MYVYVLVPVFGFRVWLALMPMSKIRGQFWAVTTLTQVAMVMSVSPRNIAGGIVTKPLPALAKIKAPVPTLPVPKLVPAAESVPLFPLPDLSGSVLVPVKLSQG